MTRPEKKPYFRTPDNCPSCKSRRGKNRGCSGRLPKPCHWCGSVRLCCWQPAPGEKFCQIHGGRGFTETERKLAIRGSATRTRARARELQGLPPAQPREPRLYIQFPTDDEIVGERCLVHLKRLSEEHLWLRLVSPNGQSVAINIKQGRVEIQQGGGGSPP